MGRVMSVDEKDFREFIVTIERIETKVDTLIYNDKDKEKRIRDIEKFTYKSTGILAFIVFLSQIGNIVEWFKNF